MIKDHKLLYNDSIENICKTINGKVYETTMSFEESRDFRKDYLLLSEKQEEGMMKARFISEEKISDIWRSVSPNIEDVFLYKYRDIKEV